MWKPKVSVHRKIRPHLGRVRRERILHEPADVVVDLPPLTHRPSRSSRNCRRGGPSRLLPWLTSVPAIPIAIPMSACLSAGASLTPSPVMATISPRAWSAWTMREFLFGRDARIDADAADYRSPENFVGLSSLNLGGRSGPPHAAFRGFRAASRSSRAGGRVITGDHHGHDSRLPACRDWPRAPRGAADRGGRRPPRRVRSCSSIERMFVG